MTAFFQCVATWLFHLCWTFSNCSSSSWSFFASVWARLCAVFTLLLDLIFFTGTSPVAPGIWIVRILGIFVIASIWTATIVTRMRIVWMWMVTVFFTWCMFMSSFLLTTMLMCTLVNYWAKLLYLLYRFPFWKSHFMCLFTRSAIYHYHFFFANHTYINFIVTHKDWFWVKVFRKFQKLVFRWYIAILIHWFQTLHHFDRQFVIRATYRISRHTHVIWSFLFLDILMII